MSENEAPARAERGARKFPYYSLSVAIELAEKLYNQGGGSAGRPQMAEIMRLSPNASSLEMRIITATMFGLVTRKEGTIVLTDLGRRVAAPMSVEERGRDLSEAFDKVPLFDQVRRKFLGTPLPNESGLKVLLVRDIGIAPNQQNDAYNNLIRSAKEAGIYSQTSSGSYLTSLSAKPTGMSTTPQETPEKAKESDSNSTNVLSGNTQATSRQELTKLHPSLVGLVNELETEGLSWDSEQRAVWNAAWQAMLDYVYPGTRRKTGGGESRMGQDV